VLGVSESIFDEAGALALLEGDHQLLQELLTLYVSAAPALVEDGRQACARRDMVGVARAAHRLRGNSSQIGGLVVNEVALDIETNARAGNAAVACRRIDELGAAVQTLCAELRARLAR
jgi:two-component system sensor histidine kinase/response regulator